MSGHGVLLEEVTSQLNSQKEPIEKRQREIMFLGNRQLSAKAIGAQDIRGIMSLQVKARS